MASGVIQPKSIVKLWENSSPTSSFAGQEVALPANSCDAFMVVYRFANNRDSIVGTVVFEVGEQSLFSIAATTNMAVGNFSGALLRATSASTQTSITFADAHVAEAGSSNTTNNIFLIPLRIYGIYSS